MTQDIAWMTSLLLMSVVVIIFAAVCRGASRKGAVERPYRGRSIALWTLLITGLGIAIGTLLPWPLAAYARDSAHGKPVTTINVVGHQWRWELSATEVPVGKPVEFTLTAADVNHGFGVYKAKQRLLAQVQAMPGFTNRLVVIFPEPGEYELLCMEYCGLAHHNMIATLTAR